MSDDYDYDWAYPEKKSEPKEAVKSAKTVPKKGSGTKTRPVSHAEMSKVSGTGADRAAKAPVHRSPERMKVPQSEPVYDPKGRRNPDKNVSGEREKDTAIAVTCLVFAIISLLTSWILIGLGFSIAAFILAIIVLKNKYYGKGYAIGGLVVSIISFLIGLILPIVLIISVNGALGDLKTYLIDNVFDAVAGDYLYDYIEEFGEDYVRQYIDEAGESFIDDLINEYGY